ncbi:MAG: phosphate ABC transporter permease subunit PstC [Candidatus Ancillula sp.]|jgi:phosphate transport system permease protein|nr:phosphate ABC transporter permease subunit PstC [Candidatus Ancillula sp.]
MHKSFFERLTKFSGALILVVLVAIFVFLFGQALPALTASEHSLNEIPWFANAGVPSVISYVLPLIFGTILSSFLALVIAVPLALGISLFIVFYAPKHIRQLLANIVDLLAAIPSVIYGLWAVAVLMPMLFPIYSIFGSTANPPRVLMTVSIVFAIMILPIVSSLTREMFEKVPVPLKEAALGLGATKWEMISTAVLPFAKNGILSSVMLGLGRALGETMAVLIILSPGRGFSLDVLSSGEHQTIAGNIAAQFPEANGLGVSALIETGLVLFLITFLVNLLSRKILERGVVK